MKIRKFQAASVREAIAQVRQELGSDAMIVATRQIRRGLLGTGVEVTAAVDNDEEAPPVLAAPGPHAVTEGTWLSEHDVERIMAPLRSELRSIRAILRPLADDKHDGEMRVEMAALRDSLAALRSELPADDRHSLHVEIAALRDAVAAIPRVLPDANEPLRAQIAALRDAVGAVHEALPAPVNDEPIRAEIAALRDAVGAIHEALPAPVNDDPIRAEIAGLRDAVCAVHDAMPGRASDESLRAEIAALRDAVSSIQAAMPDADEPVLAEIAALREAVFAISFSLPETTREPIQAELIALREALSSMQSVPPPEPPESIRAELAALREAMTTMNVPPFETMSDPLRLELQALREAVSSMKVSGAPAPAPHRLSLEEIAQNSVLTVRSQHRAIALVGPTGVGKTTTIAKLAARAALVEKKSVAIITLDTYRVGGEDQIRAYADLIGVPLTLVADPSRLKQAMALHADKQRVFIDTAGRSPRDAQAIAALERAFDGIDDLEVHLAIAASTQAEVIDSCVQRYQGVGIDRLLFTKLDEADDLTELVRAPARLGRPISFVTTGQRVPEDLEEATAESLLALATAGLDVIEVAA